MTHFTAHCVPVLRFTNVPDRSGEVIHPDCELEMEKSVAVTFENRHGTYDIIGTAALRRVGDELLADMDLVSSWDSADARHAIAALTPAITGMYLEVETSARGAAIIKRMSILSITLGDGNADSKIGPLGVKLIQRAKELQ